MKLSLLLASAASATELSGQCFKDVPARYLNGAQYMATPNMTVEKCKELCLGDGFAYAGVQYSKQCFCGDTAPTITATNCDMQCSGDKDQFCGGRWAMNVYSTSTKAYSCEHASQSPGSQTATLTCADGYIQVNKATYGKPNPNMCVQNATKDKVCASPADHTDRVKAECDGETTCTYRGKNDGEGDPCQGVHKHTEIEYSCVKPSDNVYSCEHRHQGQTKAKLRCSDGKTIKVQFATYGSTDENICPSKHTFGNKDNTCETTIDHTAAVASACDGEETCEYHGTNSLGDPCPMVEKFTHIHYVCQDLRVFSGECMVDTGSRVLGEDWQMNNADQSVESCLNFCKGYKYAGVQYSKQCFCGNDSHNFQIVPDNQCNMKCTGNKDETCGGTWRMNVYSVEEAIADLGIYDVEANTEILSGRTVFPEYEVSVDLKITGTVSGWSNIFAMQVDSAGADNRLIHPKNGDRIPAVFLHSDSSRLHICSGINGNHNYCYNSEAMDMDTWFNVKIVQTMKHFTSAHANAGSHIFYQIFINGDQVFEIQNDAAQTYENVKAEFSNGYPTPNTASASKAQYRNFAFSTTASNDAPMTAQLDQIESDFAEMLYYTNLKPKTTDKFNKAFAVMGDRFKEKFAYLKTKCTFPSTWDQEQLEDAVDRYQRAENPCDAVDNIIDAHENWGEIFTRNCVLERNGSGNYWRFLNRRMTKLYNLGDRLKDRLEC